MALVPVRATTQPAKAHKRSSARATITQASHRLARLGAMDHPTVVMIVLGVVIVGSALFAFFKPHQPEDPGDDRGGLVLCLAGDVSDSAQIVAVKNRLFDASKQFPTAKLFRVYKFGHEVQLIYTGKRVRTMGGFNRAIGRELTKNEGRITEPVTRPDLLLEQIVADLKAMNGSVAVVIATDGGMEISNAAMMAKMKKLTEQLAANPSVKLVAVIGVKARHRLLWERICRPLENRAVVLGDGDVLDGFVGGRL